MITKGTTPKNKSGNGDVNFIKIENIDSISGEISSLSCITIEEHEGYLKRSQLQENDILFSIAGTLGRVTTVPKRILPANTNQALAIIRLKDGYLNYITTYLKGKAVRTYIKKNPTVGAQPNLSLEQVGNLEISLPDKHEQIQIGSFFSQLDNLITLHQRKCEMLQKIKKSMLEKMFPQNSSRFPEIRFKGFTEPWEQRKFGDLYQLVTQKNDLTYGIDRNITVATMRFKSDIRVTEEAYLRTYNVFLVGDIAFEGHQSKEFRYGRFVENDIGNGIVSHIFAVFRPKVDYDLMFWKYAINNERLMQPVLSRCTKASTMMNDLVASDFLSESFLVPRVEEQAMIGSFIKQLDNLITLHQRKCDTLKQMKQALLQKMFV